MMTKLLEGLFVNENIQSIEIVNKIREITKNRLNQII